MTPTSHKSSARLTSHWRRVAGLVGIALACSALAGCSRPPLSLTADTPVPRPHVDPRVEPILVCTPGTHDSAVQAPCGPVATPTTQPQSHGVSSRVYQGSYFSAWLPEGFQVTGETSNGIDIAAPNGSGTISFAYATGYPGSGTPDGFRDYVFRAMQLGNASVSKTRDLGSATDMFGTQWSLQVTDFAGAVQGADIHGSMTIAVGNSMGNAMTGMMSAIMAPSDRWSAMSPALAAVERSIVITRLAPQADTSGLNHPNDNPLTDDNSPYWTRADSEERLSHLREESTGGFVDLTSPSTGSDYRQSIENYQPTGPDGPGYYRQLPDGTQEKLNLVLP